MAEPPPAAAEPGAQDEPPYSPHSADTQAGDDVQDEDEGDGDEEDTSLLGQIEQVWQHVVRDVRPFDSALQAILRGVQPVDIEDTTVVLLASSKFHKENIEKPRKRQIVEEVLSKHMGATFAIRCTFEAPKKKKDFRRQVKTARKDQLVSAAMNIFNADIIKIEEELSD
jgi:DNA polymerase-3 subunit gamma/tau